MLTAHITIGTTPVCEFPMSRLFLGQEQATRYRLLCTCSHFSVRDAVMVATFLDEAGVGNGNINVVLGECPNT